MLFLLWLVAASLLAAGFASDDASKTKSQLLNELKLRKAQVELNRRDQDLSAKKREFEIAEALFNERIYTLKELNDAQKAFEEATMLYQQAELTLRETRLNFLKDATHISVTEAKKFILPDGWRMVKITLKNMSNVSEATTYLSRADDAETADDAGHLSDMDRHMSLARLNSLLEVQNIIVSVFLNGTIISKPYEEIIPSLKLHEEKTLIFQLLEETEQISIQLTFLDETMQVPVKLEAEFKEVPPLLEAMQFSQEAYLGEQATYGLRVERFSSGRTAFQLAVVNLPHQVTYQFADVSGARLSQVSFQQNETSLNLSLQVFLPELPGDQIEIDRPVEFWALILPREEYINRQHMMDRKFTQAQIDSLQAGKVRLELVPRGVGRMEIRAVNLYREIKTDEGVTLNLSVYNDGTRRINNVQVVATVPPAWRTDIAPNVIPSLLPGQETGVVMKFQPPEGVSVGDYEIALEAKAVADNRQVDTRPKVLRIHVSARTDLLLSGALILSVIAMIFGVVWYGVKVTRR